MVELLPCGIRCSDDLTLSLFYSAFIAQPYLSGSSLVAADRYQLAAVSLALHLGTRGVWGNLVNILAARVFHQSPFRTMLLKHDLEGMGSCYFSEVSWSEIEIWSET